MTNKVQLDEIIGLQRYEDMRDSFRAHIIESKRRRRVSVGDRVTFVFENHETMLFQIQEMLRAEQIVDLDRVREEIEVYNALVPNPGELSSTMLIEITGSDRIREELVELIGIDEAVTLVIGDHVVAAVFEAGRSKEDKLSAVQYVRFPLTPQAIAALQGSQAEAAIVIDHPRYQHRAVIPAAVRQSLVEDLV
jgi:hypothetical protein